MNTGKQVSTNSKAPGDVLHLPAAQSAHPRDTLYQISTPYQLASRYPAMTIGQIRWAIFHEEENGLAESGALTRFGRRILINEEKFFWWLFSKQRKAA